MEQPTDPGFMSRMPRAAEAQQALRDGRYVDAEVIFRDVAAQVRKLFGSDHIEMAMALEGLVKALEAQGKHDEAMKYHELANEVLVKRELGFK